jgi:Kef-type K+ transport system membrane component KefB
MSQTKWWGKTLRVVGIILMGITAVFTLMAGIGTTCVAVAAKNFSENMAKLAPYSWLYILFVIITTAIGVYMVKALISLIKKKPQGYRQTIISLILGIGIGVIHMIVSRSLRGSSMPTDGVVYVTVLTLIVFAIFKIPGIWNELHLDGHKPDDTNRIASAFTLLLCGTAVLSAPIWGASTHTFIEGGTNWANAWPVQMNLIGTILILSGLIALILPKLKFTFNLKDQHIDTVQ